MRIVRRRGPLYGGGAACCPIWSNRGSRIGEGSLGPFVSGLMWNRQRRGDRRQSPICDTANPHPSGGRPGCKTSVTIEGGRVAGDTNRTLASRSSSALMSPTWPRSFVQIHRRGSDSGDSSFLFFDRGSADEPSIARDMDSTCCLTNSSPKSSGVKPLLSDVGGGVAVA